MPGVDCFEFAIPDFSYKSFHAFGCDDAIVLPDYNRYRDVFRVQQVNKLSSVKFQVPEHYPGEIYFSAFFHGVHLMFREFQKPFIHYPELMQRIDNDLKS